MPLDRPDGFLGNDELLRSDVVANSTMNRSRGLAGVNSYGKDLRFDILPWLLERRAGAGAVAWYDVCCGEGRALAQAAGELRSRGVDAGARLVGVDLVLRPGGRPNDVELYEGDASTFTPPGRYDLITCVHGLHYVGDKLGLIARLSGLLAPGGLFVANLDPANVRIGDRAPGWAAIARSVTAGKSSLSYRGHVLRVAGGDAVRFGVRYEGAAVSAVPNYTGITVIDSSYAAADD